MVKMERLIQEKEELITETKSFSRWGARNPVHNWKS